MTHLIVGGLISTFTKLKSKEYTTINKNQLQQMNLIRANIYSKQRHQLNNQLD